MRVTGISGIGALPAAIIAALPKAACPACWPAWMGVLSSLGLGALTDDRWLLPLATLFLAVALALMARAARQRRRLLPLLVAVAAAAAMLGGRFALGSQAAAWAGSLALIAASVWNGWPAAPRPGCH